MYIAKITLQGFKSFPEKTTLDFGPGISAVVGPNGCGKSNILDAMRWCFGTQSPKQLRGASMQDVIYAGGAQKPQMGFAEVSITFANDKLDGPEPWRDTPEICLTRRVDRSGDSEYRMNNARVRRRDVQEFLMDIGYGEYSIVQQGQIGQLVQARPEDVRVFIEQASRMTKFRARREEAQGKLERTEENLERVLDLVQEIERQMGSLKRQAEKAQKAKELDSELQQVSAILLARDLDERKTRIETLKTELTGISDRIRLARTQISKFDADQEELHALQESTEQGFQERFQVQRQLQDARGELQNRLSALDNEKQLRETEIIAADQELAEIAEEFKQVEEELAEIQPQAESHEAFVSEHREQLESLELSAREKRLLIEDLRQSQEQLREQLMETQESEVDCRTQENRARMTLQNADDRLQELDREIAAANQRVEQEKARQSEFETQLAAAQTSAGEARTTHAEAMEQLKQVRQELETRHAQRSGILRSLQDARIERDKVNTALAADRAVIKVAEGAAEGITTPWSLVSPKAGNEDLIETALAQRFSTLLVESPEVARALAESLQGGRSESRVQWLQARYGDQPETAVAPPDTIPISELLQSEAEHTPWVRRLTRGVFVSNQPLSHDSPPPSGNWEVIWDRNGTSVDKHGIWSAGSLSRKGTAHLAARRDQLETESTRLQQQLQEAEAQIKQMEASLEGLQERRDALAQTLSDAQRTSTDLSHEFSLIQENLTRLQNESEQRQESRNTLLTTRSEAQQQLESAQTGVAELRAKLAELQQQMATGSEKLAPAETELAAAEAQRNELQREIDGRREQLVIISRHVEASRERRNGYVRRQDQLQKQTAFARQRLQDIAGETEKLETEIAAKNETLAALAAEIEEIRANQSGLRERQIELEKSIRSENQNLDKLQQEHNRKEQELGNLQHAVDSSIEQYTLRFGVHFEPPAADVDQPTEDLLLLRDKLEERRARLGAINPAALEEYEDSKKRYDAMVAQREDLLSSIEKLRQSIRKMNKESREKFKVAFETVNRNFGEIFVKLFRGGKAELQLTDPDDWLESGVQIIAQPPGTNLQRLELLSGGQSAMTAISLILAIFLTNPSPFCILDEVDAPLDDANVSRFSDVLVEMNELAQILMVTHNKSTMEIADTLYGVTMEQRGISKAISVRLG